LHSIRKTPSGKKQPPKKIQIECSVLLGLMGAEMTETEREKKLKNSASWVILMLISLILIVFLWKM